MFICITLPLSKILRLANRNRVRVTNPTKTADAVRVTMLVTVLMFGASVGMGLSVGVVGGGTTH